MSEQLNRKSQRRAAAEESPERRFDLGSIRDLAKELGKTERQTFHLVETKQIPAGKVRRPYRLQQNQAARALRGADVRGGRLKTMAQHKKNPAAQGSASRAPKTFSLAANSSEIVSQPLVSIQVDFVARHFGFVGDPSPRPSPSRKDRGRLVSSLVPRRCADLAWSPRGRAPSWVTLTFRGRVHRIDAGWLAESADGATLGSYPTESARRSRRADAARRA